jgi:hypothetical protein
VVALLADFLGPEGVERSAVARSLSTFDHVNLQAALDAWSHEPGREVIVHGITLPPRFGGITLGQLLSGEGLPPLRLSAPPLADLPDGPGSTLACILMGVLLVSDALGRYVLMVNGPSEHDPNLELEIAGLPVGQAQAVHARLAELRHELNVYRGHVLEVHPAPMGITLEFGAAPGVGREDVVLPESILTRVERHALAIAAHREELLDAGQHLKRGLLLHGPPGTGKTHTMRYLVGQMSDYTRLVLTGRALHAIGSVAEIARDLQPAVVVLEDVDLVAEERGFGSGASPVLFDLLDAMDGADADADLLFVLTCSSRSRRTPHNTRSQRHTSRGRWMTCLTAARRSLAACSGSATTRTRSPPEAAQAHCHRPTRGADGWWRRRAPEHSGSAGSRPRRRSGSVCE